MEYKFTILENISNLNKIHRMQSQIKYMRKLILLSISMVMFLGFIVHVNGQVNPSQINVNTLTDSQIRQIADQVNTRGLTMDQAAALARAQGATPDQVDLVIRRIQELRFTQGESISSPSTTITQSTESDREAFSFKAETAASAKAKKIFGFNLFNSENLTFEPSINIPAPQNYVMGIGDELVINVWGASQNVYNLRVDQNGTVNIPDIGPVNLMGLSFEEGRNLLKRRLMAIYNGMSGANPNTWAEVSLSNLRSIKVNVVGDVLIPGTYTLPATASVFNALYLSGGPGENGSFRNVQVIRDNKVIQTLDVYDFLISGNTIGNIVLREQDIIFIPAYTKRIETTGNFKRSAIFELKETETMADLIRFAGGFNDEAYTAMIAVERITATQRRVSDVPSSLFDSFLLQNGDKVNAGEILDRFDNRVTIQGAVFRPGTYELTPGLTLSGLIDKADGVRENVFNNRGLLLRLQEDLTPLNISFNVDDIINGRDDIVLEREDAIVIRDINYLREEQNVRILGQVQEPGTFTYRDNMTLQDIVFLAKGFTEAASNSYIEVARRNSHEKASELSNEMVSLYRFEIDRDLKLKNNGEDFILQPFDYVYVRRAPSYFTQKTVSIRGEVQFPGDYSISTKTERISDLIRRAGGLTPEAFTMGAVLLRNPDNLSLLREAISTSGEEDLLSSSAKNLSVPRLELRMNEILRSPGGIADYVLKEGDEIIIPEIVQEVRISGEILNPIGLAFEKGKSMRYYIDRTGGFSSKAHRKKVFVIYSDGTADITRSFIFKKYPIVEPGSQIIVPEKPIKEGGDQTAKWLGVASTMSSLTIAIAAVLRVL
jgi:protein involved in polysaccharide export with SLBB domain